MTEEKINKLVMRLINAKVNLDYAKINSNNATNEHCNMYIDYAIKDINRALAMIPVSD